MTTVEMCNPAWDRETEPVIIHPCYRDKLRQLGLIEVVAESLREAKTTGREGGAPVPKYYIDTSDQNIFCRDEEGKEYPDLEAAKNAAVSALPDMARDELPDGDARSFVSVIRDEAGKTLLVAGLSLHVTRLQPEDPNGDA